MLSNTEYNKTRLLKDLSCMLWFIKKHAEADAQADGEQDFAKSLTAIAQDLDNHIKKLKKQITLEK